MKIKFEVIRLNNEDVISTSCNDAFALFHLSSDEDVSFKISSKLTHLDGNSSSGAINNYLADFIESNSGMLASFGPFETNKSYNFHIMPNGTLENCPDPDNHNSSNWFDVTDNVPYAIEIVADRHSKK